MRLYVDSAFSVGICERCGSDDYVQATNSSTRWPSYRCAQCRGEWVPPWRRDADLRR